jgi:hypothetical protein
MRKHRSGGGSPEPAADVAPRWASPLCVLGLLALLLLAFGSMVFRGHEPVAADTAASEPYARWVDESLRDEGRIPLWYPGIFLGMPSYASFIYTPASPLVWVHRAFAMNRGTRYVLWLLIGASALFALSRRWGASRTGAFLGACAFTFTPYVLGLIGVGHSSKLLALALAPLVFLAMQVLLERGGVLAIGLAAWAIALQLWSNHPQIVFYTWLLLAPYGAIWLWKELPGRRVRRAGAALAAIGLAGLMVTLPYLPVAHYTPESTRGAASVLPGAVASGTQSWEYATAWSFHPLELVTFLFPAFFGLHGASYWGDLPFTQSTHAFGIVPLLFSVLGLIVARGWRRWFLLGAALVVMLIGFGRHLPALYRPLYELLPLFDRFRVPSMIYAMLPLLAALAMAGGLDAVGGERGRSEAGERARRRLESTVKWSAIVLGSFAVIGLVGFAGLGRSLADAGWFRSELERATGRVAPEMIAQRQRMLFGDVLRSAIIGACAAGVAWARLRGRLRGWTFWGIAGGLLAIDLYSIDRQFYAPRPKPESAAHLRVDPVVVREIQRAGEPVRVLPLVLVARGDQLGLDLKQGNEYALDKIQSVSGYHPAGLRRVKDFVLSEVWRNPAVWRVLDVAFVPVEIPVTKIPEGLRDALGRQLPGVTEVLARETAGGSTILYRHDRSLGRAFVVPEARVIEDPVERLAAMGSASWQADRVVFLESPAATRPTSEAAGSPMSETRIARYEPERIEIEVAGLGGYLVIADAYDPDWRAEIDGEPTEVYPANHVTRAVRVAPGRHHVVFHYEDPSYATARVLSWGGRAGALGLIAAGLLLAWRGRRTGKGTAGGSGRGG